MKQNKEPKLSVVACTHSPSFQKGRKERRKGGKKCGKEEEKE
jgi:hypothetical protein